MDIWFACGLFCVGLRPGHFLRYYWEMTSCSSFDWTLLLLALCGRPVNHLISTIIHRWIGRSKAPPFMHAVLIDWPRRDNRSKGHCVLHKPKLGCAFILHISSWFLGTEFDWRDSTYWNREFLKLTVLGFDWRDSTRRSCDFLNPTIILCKNVSQVTFPAILMAPSHNSFEN